MEAPLIEIVRELNKLKADLQRTLAQDYPYQSLYFVYTPGVIRPITIATTNYAYCANPIQADIFIYTVNLMVNVATTNNGTNYWTATIRERSSANAANTLGTVDTSAGAAGVNLPLKLTLNTKRTLAQLSTLQIDWALTGAPGALSDFGAVAWASFT